MASTLADGNERAKWSKALALQQRSCEQDDQGSDYRSTDDCTTIDALTIITSAKGARAESCKLKYDTHTMCLGGKQSSCYRPKL